MLMRKFTRTCVRLLIDQNIFIKNDFLCVLQPNNLMINGQWSLLKYCSTSSSNVLKLHERGLLQTVFPPENTPELLRKLSSPQTMYCGFDPTADSLHIGNLLAMMALIHCQRGGHHPICVMGGATAMIGDPSGRTKDRLPMTAEEIENNIISITQSIHRIFDNHEQYLWNNKKSLPKVKILNNATWYKDRGVIEFLSTIGRHFRMGKLLHRGSIDTRIKSAEGMNLTEFTYQMFQAYDWYYLLKNYNCLIQMGGNDQLGNLTTGYEFIQRLVHQDVFALTVPLVTSSSGDKLGKTAGNSVWLNPDKTPPYELYQFFINLPDSDVETYLKLFTFLSDTEIKDVMNKQKSAASNRPGQKTVAEHVTKLVHGETGLEQAVRWTKAFFSGNIEDLVRLDQSELKQLFKNATTIKTLYEPGMTVFDVCMKAKCFGRAVDAERVIKEGGVRINHRKVKEPDYVLLPGEHILPNDITLLRVGQKNYYVVEWLKA